MSKHPLVTQLHFARSELQRCLEGVTAQEAIRRFDPMNCISWIVGHLAAQEHYLWVEAAQGHFLAPGLYERVGFGQPATTPPLDEMWAVWTDITDAADRFLLGLTDDQLGTILKRSGRPLREDAGTSLLRNIWHYWYHIGEAHAIRQMMGHRDLPQFVGNMAGVLYRPADGR